MQGEIEEVLLLQTDYTPANTPAMERRGLLVRQDMSSWLSSHAADLASACGLPLDDYKVEGRDATGLKSEIPWVRFCSRHHSPRATTGWYVVYLFSATGDRCYLSLNQGTTRWANGEYQQRAPEELASRVGWAREVLASTAALRVDRQESILLDARRDLGRGYEAGNVFAFEYPLDAVPADSILLTDALFMAHALRLLYEAGTSGSAPGDAPPEVVDVLETISRASGSPSPGTGQGFRLSVADRDAIDAHAMKMATLFLRAEGWVVKDVSRTVKVYDLHATSHRGELHVEVKGTTSEGRQVILTRREVEHHRANSDCSCLLIVHSIRLDRSGSAPIAEGGVIRQTCPWIIAEPDLTVVGYTYLVPFE